MIVVTVELWPYGYESNKELLGIAHIINDGSGTLTKGNYRVILGKKGQPNPQTKPYRLGKIMDYPRKSLNFWNLIQRALNQAVTYGTKSNGI